MFVEALLLTKDPNTTRLLKRVLDSFAIHVRLASEVSEAREILKKQKIDAALIDCELPDAAPLVTELRAGKANRSAIVFAVIGGEMSQQQAFKLGASFVLPKPVSADLAMRAVRASHGLILRERRRYFRHELSATAHMSFATVRDLVVDVCNISEGGMLLATEPRPEMKGTLAIRMNLPGVREPFSAGGEFLWTSDAQSRVAIKFTGFTGSSKANLEQFLNKRLEESEAAAAVTGARR
jgi:CheY-like chemotaxis protein